MQCVLCGGVAFDALPEPHPAHSVVSDLRIIAQPLGKAACRTCGLICRIADLAPEAVFDERYDLYAHAPGRAEETLRQRAYAQWLTPYFDGATNFYEAGAGNGSLLLALSERIPGLQGAGVEPAGRAASFARDAGFGVETGLLDYAPSAAGGAEIAYAINVIEHTPDPLAFINMLASHSADRVAIVCPQGAQPNVELLFADHRYSFEPSHMRDLFHAASLEVVIQTEAPAQIGPFFLTIGRKAAAAQTVQASGGQSASKAAYLQSWRELDTALQMRIGGSSSIMCFGSGEAAGLLRAYAPQTWQRLAFCSMDSPASSAFGELELKSYAKGLSDCALLGVRPAVQEVVAKRLQRDGYRVIRWDDVVAR